MKPARFRAIAPDFPVTEIGEVLDGAAEGRRHGRAITVYKSLGVIVQDLAVLKALGRTP